MQSRCVDHTPYRPMASINRMIPGRVTALPACWIGSIRALYAELRFRGLVSQGKWTHASGSEPFTPHYISTACCMIHKSSSSSVKAYPVCGGDSSVRRVRVSQWKQPYCRAAMLAFVSVRPHPARTPGRVVLAH